jgi:hypothetical protein
LLIGHFLMGWFICLEGLILESNSCSLWCVLTNFYSAKRCLDLISGMIRYFIRLTCTLLQLARLPKLLRAAQKAKGAWASSAS